MDGTAPGARLDLPRAGHYGAGGELDFPVEDHVGEFRPAYLLAVLAGPLSARGSRPLGMTAVRTWSTRRRGKRSPVFFFLFGFHRC